MNKTVKLIIFCGLCGALVIGEHDCLEAKADRPQGHVEIEDIIQQSHRPTSNYLGSTTHEIALVSGVQPSKYPIIKVKR